MNLEEFKHFLYQDIQKESEAFDETCYFFLDRFFFLNQIIPFTVSSITDTYSVCVHTTLFQNTNYDVLKQSIMEFLSNVHKKNRLRCLVNPLIPKYTDKMLVNCFGFLPGKIFYENITDIEVYSLLSSKVNQIQPVYLTKYGFNQYKKVNEKQQIPPSILVSIVFGPFLLLCNGIFVYVFKTQKMPF